MGGAQAIAALAYGTATVGAVDKILGPGNIFVALAKQQVYGAVAIDGLAGPTECLLVADDTANPTFLAADLIAQAEHDPLAQPILFCTSREIIEKTLGEAERMIEEAPRANIIRESLAGRGGVVRVPDVKTAIELANEYAPEHLTLCVRDAWSRLGQIENAGGVFIGDWSAEAIGDYAAGPASIVPDRRDCPLQFAVEPRRLPEDRVRFLLRNRRTFAVSVRPLSPLRTPRGCMPTPRRSDPA